MSDDSAAQLAIGYTLGMLICSRVCGIDLTVEQTEKLDAMLRKVADGEETLSYSVAELKLRGFKASEVGRQQAEQAFRAIALMVIQGRAECKKDTDDA